MENFMKLILNPLKGVYTKIAAFLPNLLAMLIILLLGLLVARIVRAAMLRLLFAVNFDSWSDRMGLTAVLRKGDMWMKPSVAVASFTFWLLVITAIIAGVSALNIPALDNLVSQFILYLPRALSGVLILLFGYIITGFIGRAVLISGVNRGYHFAKLLAEAVRLLLIVFFIAMALEQLQVAPGIVVSAFSIIFGGIVLALAIAFGAGGIDAARKIIGQEMEKKGEEKQDMEHI
jgi:hypothetical protein